MCGITGVFNFSGRSVEQHEIESLTDALAHRGRDSAAFALGGVSRGNLSAYSGIALGHRRLSIIDLSPHSAQPMATHNNQLWIVYNGELYNYRELRQELIAQGCVFRTESDSEVVLQAFQAWGEACLHRFNGMFAFAIWSEKDQSLFCARDPIGIKPFYYIHDETSFQFSSESQALISGKNIELDSTAVTSYFFSMYVPRHLSIFSGVKKLLPGHSVWVRRDGHVKVNKYWEMPASGHRNISLNDAAKELQVLLDRAVDAQLRSDVPVGALLSGGFDSGMIIASASRQAPPMHTYSVGFDDGLQFSELPIARSLADRYGCTHHERVIRGDEVMGFLDQAIACMSEPVADSAVVPTYCLSQMAAADGIKVLLSGAGGDEVFAGYSRYVGIKARRKLFNSLPGVARQLLGRMMPRDSTFGARLQNPALDMVLYTGGSAALARYCSPSSRAFGDYLEELSTHIYPSVSHAGGGLYANMQFDLQVYLPDLLLLVLDQLTMAHTIEGRVPLLDLELIKASFSLVSQLHARPTHPETRMVMRQMAQSQLDSRTFSARKQGFSGPVAFWIENNKAKFMEQLMAAKDIPCLDNLPLNSYWQSDARDKNPYWATEVFSIYCFSRWYHTHASKWSASN